MSDLVKKGVFDELTELNEWFAEMRSILGISQKADKGRVKAATSKLVSEIKGMKEEQTLVANSYGYSEWGYIVRASRDSGQELSNSIELPEECKKCPTGWVMCENGLSYAAAKKRLPATQKLVLETLAHIENVKHQEEEGWAEEARQSLIELFVNSTDPTELEEKLFRFARDVEDEEPETTWVEAVDWARGALEKGYDLPLLAVEELLAYAEENKVEITKTHLGFIEESDYAINRWFDYLLTTSLRKTNRATAEEVEAITKLKTRALGLWKCYEEVSANDPNRPKMKRWVYDPSVSVAMLEVACSELDRLMKSGDTTTTVDWTNAIVEAVASVNDGNPLVVVEKTN
jgi:hypothetical protein